MFFINRIVAVLVFAPMFLWGSQPFIEHRYIYSIDRHLEMNGTISFEDEKMEILYSKPQTRRIVYDGSSLDVYGQNGELVQHTDLESDPMMKLYMHFISQLYRGNFKALEENFRLVYEDDGVRLIPIAPADKVVLGVDVQLSGETISKITTRMSNGDEIVLDIAQ